MRPWVALAMGYDTNINGATDEKSMTIPIAPGLPFALGGTQNSPILSGSLGLSLSKPLNNDLGLSAFGSAQLGDRHTTHQNDFTSHTAAGRAGFRLEREKHNFSIAADASMMRLDAGGLARADRKQLASLLNGNLRRQKKIKFPLIFNFPLSVTPNKVFEM